MKLKMLALLFLTLGDVSCIQLPPITWETIDSYDFIHCLKIEKLPRSECLEKHEPFAHIKNEDGDMQKIPLEKLHKHIASSFQENEKLREFIFDLMEENARLKKQCP